MLVRGEADVCTSDLSITLERSKVRDVMYRMWYGVCTYPSQRPFLSSKNAHSMCPSCPRFPFLFQAIDYTLGLWVDAATLTVARPSARRANFFAYFAIFSLNVSRPGETFWMSFTA